MVREEAAGRVRFAAPKSVTIVGKGYLSSLSLTKAPRVDENTQVYTKGLDSHRYVPPLALALALSTPLFASVGLAGLVALLAAVASTLVCLGVVFFTSIVAVLAVLAAAVPGASNHPFLFLAWGSFVSFGTVCASVALVAVVGAELVLAVPLLRAGAEWLEVVAVVAVVVVAAVVVAAEEMAEEVDRSAASLWTSLRV